MIEQLKQLQSLLEHDEDTSNLLLKAQNELQSVQSREIPRYTANRLAKITKILMDSIYLILFIGSSWIVLDTLLLPSLATLLPTWIVGFSQSSFQTPLILAMVLMLIPIGFLYAIMLKSDEYDVWTSAIVAGATIWLPFELLFSSMIAAPAITGGGIIAVVLGGLLGLSIIGGGSLQLGWSLLLAFGQILLILFVTYLLASITIGIVTFAVRKLHAKFSIILHWTYRREVSRHHQRINTISEKITHLQETHSQLRQQINELNAFPPFIEERDRHSLLVRRVIDYLNDRRADGWEYAYRVYQIENEILDNNRRKNKQLEARIHEVLSEEVSKTREIKTHVEAHVEHVVSELARQKELVREAREIVNEYSDAIKE